MRTIRYILIFAVVCFTTTATATAQSDTLFVRYDLRNGDSIQYTVDTLFRKTSFGPHYLFETDWITNTPNQILAVGHGLFPMQVESECVSDRAEGGTNELVSIKKSDSLLTVKYRVVANCCYAFLCDMNVDDPTVLNLKYIEYGTLCGCTCYHELIYQIKIDFFSEEHEENFNKLEYITLNKELKTKLK